MPDFDFGETYSNSAPATSTAVGPRPRPIQPAVIEQQQLQVQHAQLHAQQPTSWLTLFANSFAFCVVGIVIGVAVSNMRWPDFVPTPSPLTEGTYVLLSVEKDDIKEWDQEQKNILNSVLVREWADKNCTIEQMEDGTEAAAFRILDPDDDLRNESDAWQKLKKSVTLKPPSVLVASPRGVKEFDLPKNTEGLITALEKVAK